MNQKKIPLPAALLAKFYWKRCLDLHILCPAKCTRQVTRAPELIFALGHRFARRQMALPLFCSSPSLFCFSRARLQCCNPQHQYRRSIFQPNEFRGPVFVVSFFFPAPPASCTIFHLMQMNSGCRAGCRLAGGDGRERARSNIGLI